MILYFENEYTARPLADCFSFDPEMEAKKVIEAVLAEHECPYDAEVSLTLVDDERIRELNIEFRDIDRSTDVLSFPVVDYKVPGCFDEARKEAADAFDPENGALILGDIVISVDHTLAQAEEFGHSPLREYCFLAAHSALHLIGYDHMSKEEEQQMCAMQEKLLNQLGIRREDT